MPPRNVQNHFKRKIDRTGCRWLKDAWKKWCWQRSLFFFSSFEELWRGTAFGEVYDDSWQAANWILISTPWLPLERSVLHCTAGRQRRRTELEAEETGESELETTIKQFLSSRLYGIAVRLLRGNVFNLRPPASSKRREKKKKQGEKSQIAWI